MATAERDSKQLAEHASIKETTLAAYQRLADLAAGAGLKTLRADVVGTRMPKLADERFNLVVLGEFNHGKSTFVNALLGRDLLPVGITPTTATINHLVWGEKASARAVLIDGNTRDIPADRLSEWVTGTGEQASNVHYVEVRYPAPILQHNVTLVDTPGVNDLNLQRAEVTYSYVPRADAVVFLLDAGQLLKQSERLFLEEKILTRTRDRLIFVVGKIDLLDDEERATAMAYARAQLARIVGEAVVFPLSAKLELQGDRSHSGFGPFLDRLERLLTEDRGRVLLDNAVGDARRVALYLRQNLGIKRQGLELQVSELEARVQKVRTQLDGSRRTTQEHRDRIRAETAAAQALAREDLTDFVEAFCTALPAAIDAVTGDDVKRFLPEFIATKFKEFAEHEGEKIGAILERLAEEIIQVTNENVRQTLETVGRELGLKDTQVPLEVDTLKYDVGVFALGTLGTALFLFVNAFVGGLLFVATPLLAVVLKGVVDREIKAQAKEQAPQAVRRAGEALRPKLSQAISDYSTRLDEFVVQAGDTLHRGISELLDQALSERRAAGADTDRARGEVDGQLGRVEEIDRQLTALRERLWTEASTL
jgi:small GTP-binding protein